MISQTNWCMFIFENKKFSRYSGIIRSSCLVSKMYFVRILVKSYCRVNHRNVVKVDKVNTVLTCTRNYRCFI